MTVFDQFVNTHHNGTAPHDHKINSEWKTFKKLIENAPADTHAHNQHVNTLRQNLLKEEVSKQLGKVGSEAIEKQV